jgi:hypothetical protein
MTSDLPWTLVPALVFPQRSLGPVARSELPDDQLER